MATGNRFSHGLPSESTDEDEEDFTQYCLEVYRLKKWDADSLSEYYAELF